MRAAWVSMAVAVLLASGCGGGDDDDPAGQRIDPTPTYPSTDDPAAGGATTVPGGGGPASTPGGSGAATSTPAGGTGGSGGSAPAVDPAAPPTTASLADPTGDLTISADRPPRSADLAGATLTRSAAGFELRVRLGAKAPPAGTRERTMNVASFYDVTGDGVIDYEVWLNLATGGWGGAYFDNTRPRANRFGDQAKVEIEVAGDEVVARFPLTHLAAAERFRWSLASEWGRYEVIGTAAAARDDAPDGDAPARFPAA